MIRKFICEEAGQDVIEWGMLAAFLSVLMITAVTTIAPIISTWYTAVQDDITGARWRLQRAEAVLKLRSLQSSGDADAYWDFYKAQALRRNHASRYATFPLQEAA